MIPADSSAEQAAVGFGIRSQQEPKYGINTAGRLMKRSSGVEIPDWEPVMIFRAKDRKAMVALQWYMQACENADHRAVVKSRIKDFEKFAADHPELMKEPDSDVRELASANLGERT